MLERRLRLTVELKVSAGEITAGEAEKYYRYVRGDREPLRSPDTREDVARQGRLLRALLDDGEVLGKYLASIVAGEVAPVAGSRLRAALGVGSEEEILGPVIDALGGADAEHFRRLMGEGLFVEQTELFGHSFAVEWLGGEVTEMRVGGGGNDGAESSRERETPS